MSWRTLVSELSKVWQVVEEPDFPWLGYGADAYNLELRSEVLTALEDINETLGDLRQEAEDYSAKLGFSRLKHSPESSGSWT